MKASPIRLGVVAATLLTLFLGSVRPADAMTVGTAAFAGTVLTPAGMGLPCTPIPPIPDPSCIPEVVLAPKQGRTSSFFFQSTACVGLKIDVAEPKGPGLYGPLCSIEANGTVTGYCGTSLGTGSGQITWFGAATKTVAFTFKFTSVGSTFVFQGTGSKGPVVAVATVVPTAAEDCATGTATEFAIVGDVSVVSESA